MPRDIHEVAAMEKSIMELKQQVRALESELVETRDEHQTLLDKYMELRLRYITGK